MGLDHMKNRPTDLEELQDFLPLVALLQNVMANQGDFELGTKASYSSDKG